jgi:hypothetical protein
LWWAYTHVYNTVILNQLLSVCCFGVMLMSLFVSCSAW